MNKNVKKAVIAIVYTLSIVVALWIGMLKTASGKIYKGYECDTPIKTDGQCSVINPKCTGEYQYFHQEGKKMDFWGWGTKCPSKVPVCPIFNQPLYSDNEC